MGMIRTKSLSADRNFLLPILSKPLALAAAMLGFFDGASSRAEIPMKSGEKVAFLGDSITQQGQGSAGGYVQLVASGLAANGVKIEVIGAGISGHKSNDMLQRLEK